MKNLPIGIQTSSEIRANNSIYVNKTKLIHQLVREDTKIEQAKANRGVLRDFYSVLKLSEGFGRATNVVVAGFWGGLSVCMKK